MERTESFQDFYESLIHELRIESYVNSFVEEENTVCKQNCSLMLCTVCHENLREIVFLHCRHCVICCKCLMLIDVCPLCKKDIAAYIKIVFE